MQEMGKAVSQDGMKSRIKKKDFEKTKRGTSGGIALKASLEVAGDFRENIHGAAEPLLFFGMRAHYSINDRFVNETVRYAMVAIIWPI